MVHRDVKPSNCLFLDGELRLADFGLLTDADRPVSRLGTLDYMPPDGRMCPRADVYAAGLVLYQMITGLPPGEFPRLGRRSQEIAGNATLQRLNRVVLRACQPDPQDRFADAGEMLAELEIIETDHSAARVPNRRTVLIAGVLALVAAVACFSLLWPSPPPVRVNFITRPFEATILLDGTPLLSADGTPYRTPCTVPDVPAGVHRVTFRHEGLPDLEAGRFDFRTTREVMAQWGAE
jgi:serine/threonine protein kinase